MPTDPTPRPDSWIEWLLGWMLMLLLAGLALEALVQTLQPLLPWIGLALVLVAGIAAWARPRTERW